MKRYIRSSITHETDPLYHAGRPERNLRGSGKAADRRKGIYNLLTNDVPLPNSGAMLHVGTAKPLLDVNTGQLSFLINLEIIKDRRTIGQAKGLTEGEFEEFYQTVFALDADQIEDFESLYQ